MHLASLPLSSSRRFPTPSDGTVSVGSRSSNLTRAGRATTSSTRRPWTCISCGTVTCSRHCTTMRISTNLSSDAPSTIDRQSRRNSKRSAKNRGRFGQRCSLMSPSTLHFTKVHIILQWIRLQVLPMISRERQRGRKCFTIK